MNSIVIATFPPFRFSFGDWFASFYWPAVVALAVSAPFAFVGYFALNSDKNREDAKRLFGSELPRWQRALSAALAPLFLAFLAGLGGAIVHVFPTCTSWFLVGVLDFARFFDALDWVIQNRTSIFKALSVGVPIVAGIIAAAVNLRKLFSRDS